MPPQWGAGLLCAVLFCDQGAAGAEASATDALMWSSARAVQRVRYLVRRHRYRAAERHLPSITHPAFAAYGDYYRGQLALGRGRKAEAKTAFMAAVGGDAPPRVQRDAHRELMALAAAEGKRAEILAHAERLRALDGLTVADEIKIARGRIRLGDAAGGRRELWRLLDRPLSVADARRVAAALRRHSRASARRKIQRAQWKAEIRGHVAGGRYAVAARRLRRLARRHPSERDEIWRWRAEIYGARRRRRLQVSALRRLVRTSTGTERAEHEMDLAEALVARGRLLAADRVYAQQTGVFAQAARRERARLHLRMNRLQAARSVLRCGDTDVDGTPGDAWDDPWLCGWLAFRRGAYRAAMTAWELPSPSSSLMAEAPDDRTEARRRRRYWRGLAEVRAGDLDAGRSSLRALWSTAPLSYYGMLAGQQLRSIDPHFHFPKAYPSSSLVSADDISAFGDAVRPGVIRGLAFHRVGLRQWAREELQAVGRAYLADDADHHATWVADLLDALEEPVQARLLSEAILETPSADRLATRPYLWRAVRYAYPRVFEAAVVRAGEAFLMDDAAIYAVMRTESRFRPWAKSAVGARGLMQLMPRTARYLSRRAPGGRRYRRSWARPAGNIWLGSWYLLGLVERYREDITAALAAYNAGPGTVDRWRHRYGALEHAAFVEEIPYQETRRYVARTLQTLWIYQLNDGRPPSLQVLRGDTPAL